MPKYWRKDENGNVLEKWDLPIGEHKLPPSAELVEDSELFEKTPIYTPPIEVNYKQERASLYPPIGDQLDAIWKTFNSMRLAGENLPQEAGAMLGKILAVKSAVPKDTE